MNNQDLTSLKQILIRLEQDEQNLSKRISSGWRNIILGILVPFLGFCLVVYASSGEKNNDGLILLSFLMFGFVLLLIWGIWQLISSLPKVKSIKAKIQETKDEIIVLEHS